MRNLQVEPTSEHARCMELVSSLQEAVDGLRGEFLRASGISAYNPTWASQVRFASMVAFNEELRRLWVSCEEAEADLSDSYNSQVA